jgi:hypothetical protein
MEGSASAVEEPPWQDDPEVVEDPSLAMLDWMEYEASTETFTYPCESCGECIELQRVDVDEGGGRCTECGGQLLLLDDDEFDQTSPLPHDSETINHTTLAVEGSLNLQVRVLPGMRVTWKFAEQDSQAVDFTATYAVHDRGFQARTPITIVRNEPHSELSCNFTMRAGGKLVMRFTNADGDGSEKTEVLCGSAQDNMPELEPEPEPEPEPELSVPASGFSLETDDEAGGGSIYGTLPPPSVTKGGSGTARRVCVAISRLPPFATAEGDMSGVIAASRAGTDTSATSTGRTDAPRVGVTGRQQPGDLEMGAMPTGSTQGGAGPRFTISEGTVLPSPDSGRSAKKKPEGGGSADGLSESLL